MFSFSGLLLWKGQWLVCAESKMCCYFWKAKSDGCWVFFLFDMRLVLAQFWALLSFKAVCFSCFCFIFLNSLYFIQKEEKETKSGLTFRLTTKNLCLSWARLYIELAWECRVRGYCKSAQKSARSSGFSLLPFFAKKLLSITSPVDAMLLVALYGTLHHRHSFSTKVVWFGLSWTN